MLAVTVGTDRGQWITVFCGYTMQTTFVSIGLRPVAAAAIDNLQVLACGVPALGRVQVIVAVHTCHVGVNGRCVRRLIHEDRHLFACKGAREFRVGVALKAFLIVLGLCGGCREAEDRGRYDEATPSMTTLGQSGVA